MRKILYVVGQSLCLSVFLSSIYLCNSGSRRICCSLFFMFPNVRIHCPKLQENSDTHIPCGDVCACSHDMGIDTRGIRYLPAKSICLNMQWSPVKIHTVTERYAQKKKHVRICQGLSKLYRSISIAERKQCRRQWNEHRNYCFIFAAATAVPKWEGNSSTGFSVMLSLIQHQGMKAVIAHISIQLTKKIPSGLSCSGFWVSPHALVSDCLMTW